MLRCAGCALKVTDHDVEDPDNCTGRLEDLQGEFQAQDISEYPIIAKGKGTAAFKESVTGFFHTLIKAIYTSGLLFTSVELIENIQIWLGGMSAAQNRPFRHTATVVSLAVVSALCEVGNDLVQGSANSLRHSQNQRKQARVNRGRVSDLQKQSKEAKANQEILDAIIKDWFDTIYIHRYRDVDPHIRVDCAKALGDWIMIYPDVFFDGSHLRYLGWVLSDPNHSTRLEVVKQLQRFYQDKDKLSGLKTFTERFRSRLVEMATRDAESHVRAATVELLDLLREGGLLEPDDIDAIGRLIFDAEPRVRKAVVGFFAESINDAYDARLEDLGGQETLEETLGDPSDSFDRPCLLWIKLKCLVQGLDAYDAVDGDLPQHIEHGPGQDNYQLHAGSVESRFMVAAETLFDQIAEIKEWEAIAGYLLYDTSGDDQGSLHADMEAQLKQELRLSEKEEVILLEVLNSSVKCTIATLVEANSDKKAKKTKKQRDDVADQQESTARHLANLVPRLLKRFGESPQTATTVLRLERVVNLEAFQEFSQDSSTYAELLDDINKQFMTHGNEEVLVEASRALLRAKSYHELGDTTDEKIEALWEDTINTFSTLSKGKRLADRGSMSNTVVHAISKTVLRLEKLSSISKPVDYLETIPTSSSAAKSKGAQPMPPLDSLIALVNRAASSPGHRESAETAALEDNLAMHASRTVMFYFMWRIPAFIDLLKSTTTTAIQDSELDDLAGRRDAYVNALANVLKARPVNDELACAVSGQLLDAHTIMATLRRVRPSQNVGDDFMALALDIDMSVQKRILRVFGAAESTFAKLTNKHLEASPAAVNDNAEGDDEEDIEAEPAEPVDRDPEDEDDEMGADEDEDEDDDDATDAQAAQSSQMRRSQKLQKSLIAEQRLCELAAKLVLAVLGEIVDAQLVRKRLERNKGRLGPNFKEVLAHLDVSTAAGAKKTRGKKAAAAAAKAKQAVTAATTAAKIKSTEIVVEDEDTDVEEDEDETRERALREDEEMEEAEERAEDEEAAQDVADEAAESVLGD